MDNIFQLHLDLSNYSYCHGDYQAFNISDPKPRKIRKASVRDRLLHRAIYRVLCPFYDSTFISDSFSCRKNKGLHKAINRFRYFHRKVSKNNTRSCWVLKCDVKKFFDSVDHNILLKLLARKIKDTDILWLIEKIIASFSKSDIQLVLFERERRPAGRGIPIGNLTSQLFANIYLNELDQLIKHKLKVRFYIRYADDFVILGRDKLYLQKLIPKINRFLFGNLRLRIHSQKLFIKTLPSGVDFLGWVHFPNHRILRTTTKRRLYKRIVESPKEETRQSYLGLLKHGETFKVRAKLKSLFEKAKQN